MGEQYRNSDGVALAPLMECGVGTEELTTSELEKSCRQARY